MGPCQPRPSRRPGAAASAGRRRPEVNGPVMATPPASWPNGIASQSRRRWSSRSG